MDKPLPWQQGWLEEIVFAGSVETRLAAKHDFPIVGVLAIRPARQPEWIKSKLHLLSGFSWNNRGREPIAYLATDKELVLGMTSIAFGGSPGFAKKTVGKLLEKVGKVLSMNVLKDLMTEKELRWGFAEDITAEKA